MSSFTGLSEKPLTEIKKILLQTLEYKINCHVFVFGSRAKNTYKQYSDLDLWIECRPELSVKEIANLKQLFDESNLAITVDVVTPEICLPEYKNQILAEKKLWFSL